MPQAAPIIAAVAAVAGTGVAVYSSSQQAKAAKATAAFNAKVLENEAAARADERAEMTRRERIKSRRLKGRQRTMIAKAGVTESGSPLELMAETAGELELGVLDINRDMQAKQNRLTNKAAITRFEGASLASGKRMEGIGAGIGGIGQTASIVSANPKAFGG